MPAAMRTAGHVLTTILSCGLNLLIARLGLDPRWRYAVITLIIANEIRGLTVVYGVADTLL